jgi:hypothetical protein
MGEIQVHEVNKERHSQVNEKIDSSWYRMSACPISISGLHDGP